MLQKNRIFAIRLNTVKHSVMYTKKFDNQDIARFHQWIGEAREMVVIAHKNADGDACGSVLGISLMLQNATEGACHITPILPTGCPHHFGWLPGAERVMDGESRREECERAMASADLIVGVDFNVCSRVGQLEGSLRAAPGHKVLIDHHHGPEREAWDIVFSDPDISSACELVTWLTQTLWQGQHMDAQAARCLYTGLRTDTGGFAFSCSQPSCFDAAALLVGYDIQPADVHNRIVNNFSINRMEFYGFALSQRLRIFPEQHSAYFYFSQADQERFGVASADMEGLVNYTLMMEEIEVGALLREEADGTKVSLRSKNDVDVHAIATELGGGGHTKAAGADCKSMLQETIKRVEEYLLHTANYRVSKTLATVATTILMLLAGCHGNPPIIEEEQDPTTQLKENMINANHVVIMSEVTQMDGYADRRGWQMEELDDGVRYLVYKQGKGGPIQMDDRVAVTYRLELLDGTVLYSRQTDTLTVGRREVTPALDGVLLHTRYGSSVHALAPSNSAYGVVGDGDRVEPRTVIVYDILETKKI